MVQKFIEFCKNGDLDKAKEFLRLNPHINISAQNELVFILACSNGHLEFAKWLLSVKPDINISAQSDWAFRMACYNGKLEAKKRLIGKKENMLYIWLYKKKIICCIIYH